MLKHCFISEYWRAQGIYEIFRTKQSGRGYMVECLINYIMLNRLYVMLCLTLFWPLPHPIKGKNMYFYYIDCLVTDMA
jgi:hypothetical protein